MSGRGVEPDLAIQNSKARLDYLHGVCTVKHRYVVYGGASSCLESSGGLVGEAEQHESKTVLDFASGNRPARSFPETASK